jgi:hypothetical protein
VDTAVEVNEALVENYTRYNAGDGVAGSGKLLEFWALTDTDGKSDNFLKNFCRSEIKKFKCGADFEYFCRTHMPKLSRKFLPNAKIFNKFCDVFNETQKSIFSLEQKRANTLRIIWLTTELNGKLPQDSDFDDVFFKIKFSQVSDQLKMKLQCVLIENRKPITKYSRVFQNAGLFSDHTGSCSETVLNYMNSTLEKVSGKKQEN